MNWRIIPVLIIALIMGIAVSGFGKLYAASAEASVVTVVCNESVTADKLTKDNIQEMFMGRKTRWNDGQKIVLSTLKEGPAHEAFLNEYVESTPQQFLTHWKKQVYTGRGKMPMSFNTTQELIDFVKKNPGAIGYVPSAEYQNQAKSITIE